jgi:predicted signal transduction protein with EAL and GGDEF domain
MVVATASIGIAMAPIDGIEADELLKNADMALYGAKADRPGVYRFFEPKMDARMKARRALELSLRKALANDEFELYYQPAVNLDGETVQCCEALLRWNHPEQCCEALLRWNHPEQGLIMPSDFVPIAEEIGLIVPIGEWVIRRACQDATAWPDDIRVAVNLSPTQLNNSLLFPTVLNALTAAQLPAQRLELEITEAVLMQNTEANLRTLHGLRALGIRISMDDFGTGYSSLSYLRSFPFDKIKIDRCFITGLGDDNESAAIVQAIAGLAQQLGMTTTAEGVETRTQLDRVRALGCTDVQGHFYSPPVPARELAAIFAKRSAGGSAVA